MAEMKRLLASHANALQEMASLPMSIEEAETARDAAQALVQEQEATVRHYVLLMTRGLLKSKRERISLTPLYHTNKYHATDRLPPRAAGGGGGAPGGHGGPA